MDISEAVRMLGPAGRAAATKEALDDIGALVHDVPGAARPLLDPEEEVHLADAHELRQIADKLSAKLVWLVALRSA